MDWFKFRFSEGDLEEKCADKFSNEINSLINDELIKLQESGLLIKNYQKDSNVSKENDQKLQKELLSKYDEYKNIISINVNNIKAYQSFDELYELLIKYKDVMVSLKKDLSKIQKTIDDEQLKPNEKLTKLCDDFNKQLDLLQNLCKKHFYKFPWQLKYYLVKQDNNDKKVDFKGGVVTNKDGDRINVSICNLSGILLQNWSIYFNNNKFRYKCIDHNIEHQQFLHESLITVKKVINNVSNHKYENILLEISKCSYCKFVLESDIQTFLRMEVNRQQLPAMMILSSFKQFKNRLCLGTSCKFIKERPNLITLSDENNLIQHNNFKWLTYEQVGYYSITLAKSLKYLLKSRSLIGICGLNRNEFVVTDFALALADFISVGVHSTFTKNQLIHLFNNAKLSAIFCENDKIEIILDILCSEINNTIKHIILMDKNSKFIENIIGVETQNRMKKLNVNVYFMDDLISNMKIKTELNNLELLLNEQDEKEYKYNEDEHNEIMTILYTSGSTGKAKGVVVNKRCFKTDISSTIFLYPLIGVSYIPLSHSSDRIRTWQFLLNGGRIGFCNYAHSNWSEHESSAKKLSLLSSELTIDNKDNNNVETLMHNVQYIEPIAFPGPPRIWNGLFNIYNKRLNQLMNDLEKPNEEEIKKICKKEIRNMFGKRIKYVTTGGAPTSEIVMNWIKYIFDDINFTESYGCTETGAILENNKIVSNCEIKLIDLPEAGFTSNDKPYPRGEIMVKTSTLSSGYYNNIDLTNKSFINGWFKTGDLGMKDNDNNYYIIERVKAVFSLKCGMIICPNNLESIYEASISIKQIFIHGNNHNNCLCCIIIPNDLNQNKSDIANDIRKIATNLNLEQYKIPTKILLTNINFTTKNKMLNGHLKKVRSNIIKYFEKELDAMMNENLINIIDDAIHFINDYSL